jgi:hypothetical protein
MATGRESWRGCNNDPYVYWVKVKDLPERPEPAFLIGTPEYPVLHDVSTVLYGRPKSGKSMGALTMVHSLVTGEPFMGRFPVREKRTVAFLALDSGQVWETKRRIARWGEPDVFGDVLLSGVKPGNSSDEWNRLASRLEAAGVDFLFIDNLARLKGGEKRSVRNDEDMDPILANIDILESKGIAFCLIHHAGKPGEDGAPRSSPLGATTIEGWARNFVQVNSVPVKDSSPKRVRRWLELYGNDLEGDVARPEVPFAVTDKGIVPVTTDPVTGKPEHARTRAVTDRTARIQEFVLTKHPCVTNKSELGRLIAARFPDEVKPRTAANRLGEGAYNLEIVGGVWQLMAA